MAFHLMMSGTINIHNKHTIGILPFFSVRKNLTIESNFHQDKYFVCICLQEEQQDHQVA